MNDEEPTPRRFHPPTPASTLLTQLWRNQTDPSSNIPLGRLRTGVRDVDEYLLLGGVQRGCIVGVSSGDGSGSRERVGSGASGEEGEGEGRLLALHFLARNLLERPNARAAVVDATGSFPVRVLAGVVRWCVERGVGAGAGGEGDGAGGKKEGKKEVEERVMGVLERVGITRVFDVEGLWEVLGEVLGEVGEKKDDEVKGEGEGLGAGEEGEWQRREDERQNEEVPRGAAKMEIMDSEDDDEDDLNTQRPPKPPPQPQPPTKPGLKATTPTTTHQTTEVLLVDNLTTLITTLFALTSPSAAHALLSQLSRTLATLTRSSSLTVFLLNSLVVKPAKFRQGQPEQHREKKGSVFGGMKATPSLGMVFENFVDLHLMAHRLPRGVGDAEGVYGVERLGTGEEDGGDGDPETAEERGRERAGNGENIQFANVVEVLKDECPNLERWEGVSGEERPGRWVGREKRWGVFKVVGGVGLEDDEFGEETTA